MELRRLAGGGQMVATGSVGVHEAAAGHGVQLQLLKRCFECLQVVERP